MTVKTNLAAALLVLPALLAGPAAAQTESVPEKVGACVQTQIAELTSRLEGMPDSGDAVVYANGIFGVSYDSVEGMRGARVGDAVELCLVSLPEDCPPGDDRGRVYKATDLRTNESWELPDAEHMCGGA